MFSVCHVFLSVHWSLVVNAGKGLTYWLSCMWCLREFLLLSYVTSCVRCGACLYQFLIFAFFLTLFMVLRYTCSFDTIDIWVFIFLLTSERHFWHIRYKSGYFVSATPPTVLFWCFLAILQVLCLWSKDICMWFIHCRHSFSRCFGGWFGWGSTGL